MDDLQTELIQNLFGSKLEQTGVAEQCFLTNLDIDRLSPSVWAYVGDAVYELWVRLTLLLSNSCRVGQLHREAVKHVRAQSQADLLIDLEQFLTDEEKEIVRRGRNCRPGSVPKSASVMVYRYSTAFEALIGYLFLKGCNERLDQIFTYVEKISFSFESNQPNPDC